MFHFVLFYCEKKNESAKQGEFQLSLPSRGSREFEVERLEGFVKET